MYIQQKSGRRLIGCCYQKTILHTYTGSRDTGLLTETIEQLVCMSNQLGMVVSDWLIAGWFDDIHLVSQTVIIYFGTNRTQSYPTMTYCRRQKRYIYKGFHGLFLKTFMSRMGLETTFFRLRDKRLDLSPRAVRCLLVKPGMASNIILLFYYFKNQKI